jgi:hypothetical protein
MDSAWALLSLEPREPEGVMNDRFIMRFDIFLDWNRLSSQYDFSIELLRLYQHWVNWESILKRQLLSEFFLREMATNFEGLWGIVSQYQVLSEKFIQDFAHKVDWENVIMYQRVSGRFLALHKSYITPDNGSTMV